MTTAMAAAVLVVAVVLAVALARTRAQLGDVEARTRALENELHRRVEPEVAAARAEARGASVVARRAAVAAGVDDPAPRLPFEPVTGPVVKAVAFGAGARRALARVASPALHRRGLRRTA